MGLTLLCDGCGRAIAEGEATQVGRLDRCWYCAACAVHWRAYAEAEQRELREVAMRYETWRREQTDALRAKMRKVPADA